MSKCIIILAAALLLITSPFNYAAEENAELSQAEERMEEIEQNLEKYRARFNELENIGYGGATLRSDLDNLGLAVADLVKELEEIKKQLPENAILPVMVYANKTYKNTEQQTTFLRGEKFYLHHVLAYFPEDTAAVWDLFIYDQDTGKLLKEARNLKMKKEIINTRLGKVTLFTNYIKWKPIKNLKIQSVVTPENSEPIKMDPVFISIKDDSEPLNILMPDEMIEEETYSVKCSLPEGFKPPFTMTLKYKGIEGRFEEKGSMECESSEMILFGEEGDAANSGFKEPPDITMPTFYRNKCRVYKNLGRLPDTVSSSQSGKAELTMTVEDAEGRKARGRKTLNFIPFEPEIKTLVMIDPDKSDDFLLRDIAVTEARAGDNVKAYVEFEISEGDKNDYYMIGKAYDEDNDSLISSYSVRLEGGTRRAGYASINFNKFH